MAIRARLSAPRAEQDKWPWHQAKWTALSSSLIFGGDRRMEAENYLAGGYGIRLAMETRKAGWARMEELAHVWQPSRLKGISVSPEFGTPFLAATQVFDLRPIPRKFLALEKVKQAEDLFVTNGQIVVTRSGSVGRATLAHSPHEKIIISDDLLRVEPRQKKLWGWLYAYLRASQTRAMMSAAQYGHVVKHLETSHLNVLPMPVLRDDLLEAFNERVQTVLDNRNRAHELALEAEARFEKYFGSFSASDKGEAGFSVRASALFGDRRRFDALPHNPAVKAIRTHLAKQAKGFTRLIDAGYSVWLPNRFKRIPAEDGVGLLGSSDLFEINPDITKRIVDAGFGDAHKARVKAGWLLLARSGQIYGVNGSLTLATEAHEAYVVSDHIIRIAPSANASIRPGYLSVALSHPELGRPFMKSLPYGSSIPEIDVADVERLEVVRLDAGEENAIADLAEQASTFRARADILENDFSAYAEAILDRFINGNTEDVVVSP